MDEAIEYAVETLEIEIARLKQAIRITNATVFTKKDIPAGHLPNKQYLLLNKIRLERVIEILRQIEVETERKN